ncbi:Ca2+ regulator and membrane fusion protein Fig1-domain-containing protein [Limtongia smithiae]|uniref:Ca2+ regulator and membrane fusion protein Fig1-domain-containing protein n=1 Tax=Limtongia smithiae TaxID=1125753 RepID=UPI0034CD2881
MIGTATPFTLVVLFFHTNHCCPPAVLLAGCSSSTSIIPNVYLMHMGYNDGTVYQVSGSTVVNSDISVTLGTIVGDSSLEIRIGYFALCINQDVGSWLCSQNASSLAASLDTTQDPLNLLHVADAFKEKIVFPYLLIVAAALAFITFILIMPSPPILQFVSTFISFIAGILVLVSVLWQHTASVAGASIATNLGNGTVFAGVGVTAMILGWFTFGILAVIIIGLYIYAMGNRAMNKAEGLE